MRILWAFVVLASIVSCRMPPKYNSRGSSDEGRVGMSGEESSFDQQSLAATENYGSALRYADSIALTDIYGRVFQQRDFGFAHCQNDLPRSPDDCKNIFRPGERPDMGTFDMHEPGINRGPLNIQTVTSLRLSYVRTLRGMLVRECNVLIDREAPLQKNGMGAQNAFLRSAEPSAADFEFFFRSLLGIEATTMKSDFDGAAYAEAFKKSIGDAMDKDAATRATEVAICVAIAMDPHVFLY